ncbi:MAG: ATP-binding cassette domain-containing protein [Actinobacteria bacterium]|nr:MAG: ATP-binding cassette domain-containing protein [Actinomycetota bacterium]
MDSNRWRTVDIVVAAVIAVAFGVIFFAWNNVWEVSSAFNGFPPLRALLNGVWLVPAVLGPLVVRKPGAGLFTETVAAVISAVLGSPWGLITVLYGLFQGVAGEAAFAATFYRSSRLPVALAGGALAGAALIRSVLAGLDTTMVLVEHRVAEALPLVDRVVVLEPGAGVAVDGPPSTVFARYGDALARDGVWVPGHPVPPRPAAGPPGEVLVTADRAAHTDRLAPTDLTVRAGETLAVQGENGTGKTTLALALGGLIRPTSGSVTTPDGPPYRWRAATLARRIGSVFQNPEHQFVTARVADELALGPRRAGMRSESVLSTVDDLLVRLRLDRLALANPYTLSGGEQRRLSVATALATAPRLLILDEPTFGQDRRTWTELVDLLAKLRDDGCGIVTVTHDTDFVAALADRSVTLC